MTKASLLRRKAFDHRASTVAVALALLALWPSQATAQRPSPMPLGTSSISGRVTAGDTGKPIRGAVVEIVIYENLSGRFRQVTTDPEGKFEFTKLPPGHYQLAAQATRYLRMQFGQQQPGPAGLLNPARTIDLADAQAFTAADFALSRFCAIEGVIVDEFGDPAPNVAIQVSQVQYAAGRRRLVPANPSSDAGPPRPTDDLGHFRVGGLPPGDYYVEALSGAFADPNAAGGFAVTFFPGAPKASGAQAVNLTTGHDALDVSFTLAPAPMARVDGTLVDGGDHPLSRGTLMLVPSERTGTSLFVMARTVSGDNGGFAFRNVPPGTYTIQAFGRPVGNAGNLGASAFGYETFMVDGQDLVDLKVRVPAPRALRGHITFEGDTSALPKTGDVLVSARPIDFESAPIGGGPPPMTIHDDWTFEVNAMSGLRVVTVGTRQGWVMKRATLSGQDVTDAPLDLREHDINDLEIVLTLSTTTVTGTVTGRDDKPPPDCSVVVFADDDTKWTIWSRYVAFIRAGPPGTFTVTGLPAGSYVAVAAETLVNGEWQNPEFLRQQRVSTDAVHFTLADGESKTVQLRVRR
jgi:hypothetical protein